MKFASRSEAKKTMPTVPGNRMQPTREMRIDENGHKTLIITGEEDVYEFIQASLEETKIENIIKRATGQDLENMMLQPESLIDIVGAPTTLAAAQALIEKTRQTFDRLPVEVKKAFDFSPEKYVAEYGSEKWASALGLNKEPAPLKIDEMAEMEKKEEK